MPASGDAIRGYEARIAAYERAIGERLDERRARRDPGRTRRRRLPRGRVGSPRVRRILVMTWLLLMADVTVSFTSAMLKPSSAGFGVNAVEWLRDNGAAGLVSEFESIYYSFNAPATGGTALKALPEVGNGTAAEQAYAPAPIAPVIDPPLPGEGAWHGTGPLVRGAPPVLVTTFRPDPNYPQMVAGVAWIDSSRAWVQLYPGMYEPPNPGNPLAEVPPQLRVGLLATFNSAFKLEDDAAGFVAFGHVYAQLKPGQATFVRYRNGSADIRTWTGGTEPGPDVEFARQNLPLIVEGGQLNPNLGDGPQWGATLGNAVRVWRSGVGIDARGNVLYAAANDQTATSLAEILKRAGAVRAMELDINYEWVTFNFYTGFGALGPSKLLPGMSRAATRYLTPDDRDFFAVYVRH